MNRISMRRKALLALLALAGLAAPACDKLGVGTGAGKGSPSREAPAPQSLERRLGETLSRLEAKVSALKSVAEEAASVKNLVRTRVDANRAAEEKTLGTYRELIATIKAQTGIGEVTTRSPADDVAIRIGDRTRTMREIRRTLSAWQSRIEVLRKLETRFSRLEGFYETMADEIHGRIAAFEKKAMEVRQTLPLVAGIETLDGIQDGLLRDETRILIEETDGILSEIDDRIDELDGKIEAGKILAKGKEEAFDEISLEDILKDG